MVSIRGVLPALVHLMISLHYPVLRPSHLLCCTVSCMLACWRRNRCVPISIVVGWSLTPVCTVQRRSEAEARAAQLLVRVGALERTLGDALRARDSALRDRDSALRDRDSVLRDRDDALRRLVRNTEALSDLRLQHGIALEEVCVHLSLFVRYSSIV